MVVLFNKCNGAVVHPFVANTPICLTNNRAVVRPLVAHAPIYINT